MYEFHLDARIHEYHMLNLLWGLQCPAAVRCITTHAKLFFIHYVSVNLQSKGLHTVMETTCICSIRVIS
jgi:hypothetical protein